MKHKPYDSQPAHQPLQPAKQERPWYFQMWFVLVLMFCCCPPAAIALVWRAPNIKKDSKVILTGVAAGYILFTIFILILASVLEPPPTEAPLLEEKKQHEKIEVEPEKIESKEEPKLPVVEEEEEIELPGDQGAVITVIENYFVPYKTAENELKKSALRAARGKDFRSALGGKYKFKNWIGTLKSMGTTSDGKAFIEIQLEGTKYSVKTWNNSFSDLMDDTLIPQSSPVFQAISNLEEGDTVKFSGAFLESDQNDFIKEASLTELGSMADPEFVARFSNISRYP